MRGDTGESIFVADEEQQPIQSNTTNDSAANDFTDGVAAEELKKMNRQHNIEYMAMLYGLRRKDLSEWGPKTSFASMLGPANSILKFTFGIKLAPRGPSEREWYVLRHCFHFRNLRFPPQLEEPGNGIRPADWPSLDWKQPAMLPITRPEDPSVASHETSMRLQAANCGVFATASSPSIARPDPQAENKSTEQSKQRDHSHSVAEAESQRSSVRPLDINCDKIILTGLHVPSSNKNPARLQYDATKKSSHQSAFRSLPRVAPQYLSEVYGSISSSNSFV
jgi:hypothetical protein